MEIIQPVKRPRPDLPVVLVVGDIMALTRSQKPIREWPLLVLTIAIVALICVPLWQSYGSEDAPSMLSWPPERWAQLLLGPEQFVCYCCFMWALFIFACRFVEAHRQRRAFGLGLLPTGEGARILQEDARTLQRKADQLAAGHGPLILANMVRSALGKFALSRSGDEVRETVKTQAEVDQGRLAASMAMMNYLAWAIPAVGFFGTVRGLAGSMTLAGQGGQQLRIATAHLTVAFDCTLVALALSLVVMFLIYTLQREEESLVFDCQQYCLEHLVNRIYEPEIAGDGTGVSAGLAVSSMLPTPPGAIAGSLGQRAAR
jgi:biopolymer transport protein ExbB/TolQ